MFKKFKEFFFGKAVEEKVPEAPYKVESPAPLVLPVPEAVVIAPPAPIAEVAKVKRGRKPNTVVAQPVKKAAAPVKKPAAIRVVKTKSKKV